MEKVDTLELYVVGSGPKCIVWNYDIFGFDSGRTRWVETCIVDMLSSEQLHFVGKLQIYLLRPGTW